MKEKLLTNTEEQEETNILPFERPKLRMDPKDPDDPIWLNNLGLGTIFLARKKHTKDFVLGMFCLEGKSQKAVYLLEQSMGDKSIAIDPTRFCSEYECFEILRDHETYMALVEANTKQQQEETKTYGNETED